MPELPEVQTTVNGLKERIVGLTISDLWSDYDSPYFKGSDNIKDPAYFKRFKKIVMGMEVLGVSRRAKNILVHLGRVERNSPSHKKIMLIHMKMTGHLLYGRYSFDIKKKGSPWTPVEPESLKDPYNRHVHFVITFSNKMRLALSDSRKFAKVTLIDADSAHHSIHLKGIGPEPLDDSFTFESFHDRLLLRPSGRIKQVLMDQTVIAGIGNIYADESLWRAGIHPLEMVKDVPHEKLCALFSAVKSTLSRGIDFGGDSMSDYRNVEGRKGAFQERHRAYRKTGQKCSKRKCSGTIRRISVGGRSAHFCDKHQVLRGK